MVKRKACIARWQTTFSLRQALTMWINVTKMTKQTTEKFTSSWKSPISNWLKGFRQYRRRRSNGLPLSLLYKRQRKIPLAWPQISVSVLQPQNPDPRQASELDRILLLVLTTTSLLSSSVGTRRTLPWRTSLSMATGNKVAGFTHLKTSEKLQTLRNKKSRRSSLSTQRKSKCKA